MPGAPDIIPELELESIEERLSRQREAVEEELPWPLGNDTRHAFLRHHAAHAEVKEHGFAERIVSTVPVVYRDIAHVLVLYEAPIPGAPSSAAGRGQHPARPEGRPLVDCRDRE